MPEQYWPCPPRFRTVRMSDICDNVISFRLINLAGYAFRHGDQDVHVVGSQEHVLCNKERVLDSFRKIVYVPAPSSSVERTQLVPTALCRFAPDSVIQRWDNDSV